VSLCQKRHASARHVVHHIVYGNSAIHPILWQCSPRHALHRFLKLVTSFTTYISPDITFCPYSAAAKDEPMDADGGDDADKEEEAGASNRPLLTST
jgi:hypothetical protein